MKKLGWVLLVLFAAVAIQRIQAHPVRKPEQTSKDMNLENFAKFRKELNAQCRPRPGSLRCTGKREALIAEFLKSDFAAQVKDGFSRSKPTRDQLSQEEPDIIASDNCRPGTNSWCATKNSKRIMGGEDENSNIDETVWDNLNLEKNPQET